jgi:hypothetical protein
MDSTGRWKEANDPDYNATIFKAFKHGLLKFFYPMNGLYLSMLAQ